ncbi:MAG: SRPBCC family protein [Bacteroidetes bacterium]|nr:SRPBCC family protein [Bacteroidota bacterium]
MQMAATTTTVNGREITMSRLLNAPAALVWEALTKAEHLVQWWGPDGFTTTSNELSVSKGGSWRFMMHGPDGRDYPNKIIFLEIDAPHKLVYQHSGDEDTEPVNFHVTITLQAEGNGTRLVMHSIFASAEELERLNREYGAIEGGKQHISRLSIYVDSLLLNEKV